MSKHSPGPWKDGDGLSRGRFVFAADGTVVVEAARQNIALIAAAPEMLELLRDCRDLFERENKPLLAAPIAALLKRLA